MNNYAPDRPRLMLAIAAALMSATTLGSLVAWPSVMDAGSRAFDSPRATQSRQPAPTEVAILPSCIEVIGVRDRDAALAFPVEWLAKVGQRERRRESSLDTSEPLAIQGLSACEARRGFAELPQRDGTVVGAARGGQARHNF